MAVRHADEADALRADLAACLRALAGDGEADGPGVEALIAAFLERSGELQRSFAVAAMQEAAAQPDSGRDVVALRAEVEALRGELAAKETLLATHRTNVQRWQAEAVSVHEAAAATALQQPSRGELAQNGNAS